MSILKKLSVATAGASFIVLRTVETVQAVTSSYSGDTTSAPRFNHSETDDAVTASPPTIALYTKYRCPLSEPAFLCRYYRFLWLSQFSSKQYGDPDGDYDGFLALYQTSFDPNNVGSDTGVHSYLFKTTTLYSQTCLLQWEYESWFEIDNHTIPTFEVID